MRKQLLTAIILLCITLTACGTSYQEANNNAVTDYVFGNGYFTQISAWNDSRCNYYILYANDTKVKYFVERDAYRCAITPLYNADGSLQVYEGD